MSALGFYVTGGTLRSDAPSYVERQADKDLYDALLRAEFCYVLTARQMGKSSLMVRTAARLQAEGATVVVLDLTAIGQHLTVDQWYDGLLMQAGKQLDLENALETFWRQKTRLGPLQRWMSALRDIVLPNCAGRLIVFVDEIDVVRSLPFSTDEFFAAMRECYNRRSHDPEYQRLTFCLLGVAAPTDLIRDTKTTPFNIGRRIELTDFSETEAAPLGQGLGCDGATALALLSRILYWTGGHPYLTQRVCNTLAEASSKPRAGGHPGQAAIPPLIPTASSVDRLCAELFLAARARERDDNLIFVRERMLRSEVDVSGLLELYAQVRQGKHVPDDETNPLVSVLRLAGITRGVGHELRLRNRIYAHVFDLSWVRTNMPEAEVRRQRAAFRRGLALAGAGALAVLGLIAGLAINALRLHPLRVARPLPDGTLLTLESVTYGGPWQHHYENGRFRTAWLTDVLSPVFRGSNGGQRSFNHWTPDRSLVYWITRRDTNTDQYLNLELISHAELPDGQGCQFRDDSHFIHDDRNQTSSAGAGFPNASPGASFILGSGQFTQFPRRIKTLQLQFYGTNHTVLATFTLPNPAFKAYPQWTPEPLPATKNDGDLSITLAQVGGRQVLVNRSGQETEFAPTEDVFRFTRHGEPSADWEVGSIRVSDATGNTGGRTLLSPAAQYCNHEAAWRFQAKFFRKPEARFEPNQVWDAIRGVAVPTPRQIILIPMTNKLETVTLRTLYLCGPGKYTYSGGVPKAQPATEAELRSGSGPIGWATSGFDLLRGFRYEYPGVTFNVPHVALQVLGMEVAEPRQRIYLKVTDDHGRELLSRGQTEPDECFFALNLAPDARFLDLVFLVQTCRAAEFMVKPPPPQKRTAAQLFDPRDPAAPPDLVDLTEYYNAQLERHFHPGNPLNNLANLPRGTQTLNGTLFDIRGIVQLSGLGLAAAGGRYSERVEGIRVERRCRRLHFLHAANWRTADGTHIGSYLAHYSDGATTEIPIIYGVDVRDWWDLRQTTNATIAWRGTNSAPAAIALFKSTWDNPRPASAITSIGFRTAHAQSAPFLIAITAEP